MTIILTFYFLMNPGVEALSFKEPTSENYFERVPVPCKFGPSLILTSHVCRVLGHFQNNFLSASKPRFLQICKV